MSELREYHSFSGTDIKAVFGDIIFGELQMVQYKIDREKSPVYTMGSPDPRTIARGKRLISGACIFVVFDRDALLTSMEDRSTVYLPKDETANFARDSSGNFTGGLSQAGKAAGDRGGTVGLSGKVDASRGDSFNEKTRARLADQLLPFDITLVGANEYGMANKMVIHGVELMNEASGISIDDLVIEKQMTFIAKGISPWMKLTS